MKNYGILGLILLLLLTPPVRADANELFTAITNIEEGEHSFVYPNASYPLFIKIEIWIENSLTNITTESLNVSNYDCLINLKIQSSIDIQTKDRCVYPQSFPQFINNDSLIEGGITKIDFDYLIYMTEEIRNISDFNKYDLPEGSIRFDLISALNETNEIFGDHYGASLEVTNNGVYTDYDLVPDNYGVGTEKEKNFIHFRISKITNHAELNVMGGDASSTYNFNVTYEILNQGRAFVNTTASIELNWIASVNGENITDEIIYQQSGHFYFPDKMRIQGSLAISIKFEGLISSTLQDGIIEIWLYVMQPRENTFSGFIQGGEGGMTFEYAELPSYWQDYDMIDWEEAGTIQSEFIFLPLQGVWITLVLIPIKKRRSLLQ